VWICKRFDANKLNPPSIGRRKPHAIRWSPLPPVELQHRSWAPTTQHDHTAVPAAATARSTALPACSIKLVIALTAACTPVAAPQLRRLLLLLPCLHGHLRITSRYLAVRNARWCVQLIVADVRRHASMHHNLC
jgi:hypothetical protein